MPCLVYLSVTAFCVPLVHNNPDPAEHNGTKWQFD
ncbi:protein of unknown function [Pararobbsia alpina]